AARAARQARDAANQAAQHADNAAAAADEAVKQAGVAAGAADRAQQAANLADQAADIAENASATAFNVAAVAREAEAERLEQSKARMIAEAQDALLAEQNKQIDSAWVAGKEAKLDAETQALLTEAQAPGAAEETVVANGRKVAARLAHTGGSWLQEASEDALVGTEEDVVAFVRSGIALATEQDDRASAAHIADTSDNGGERLAAKSALARSYPAVKDFLNDRWYWGKDDDDQIAVSRIMEAGGPGVRAAAQAALQGTPEDRAKFLAEGQYRAAEDDDRVAVTQALSTGGPEVKAAAQAALNGPPSFQREFLEVELFRARERDADTTRHVSQIQSYLSEVAQTAALARKNANEAQQAAYLAAGAAAEAAIWADKAVASADQARVYANEAKASADQAQKSADEAASWAKKARAAEQEAKAAAAAAARSASQAAASAAQARTFARQAQAAAAQARADAIAAGKSRDEAAAAASEAKAIAAEKKRLEDWATRQADYDTAVGAGGLTADEQAIFDQGGQAALDEYRQALKDANKNIGDWLVENGAGILISMLGIDNIINCAQNPNLGDCLWALVDVGSFFFAVGKLKSVGSAILKVVRGLKSFFEAGSKARKVLQRTEKVIEDARAARRPDPEFCELEWEVPEARTASSARAAQSAAAAAAMAAPKKKCKVHHAGQADGDYVNKGPHVNMDDGAEVAIEVDKNGNLVGVPLSYGKGATQKHVDAAIDTLQKDQKLRTEFVKRMESVLEQSRTDRDSPPTIVFKDPKQREKIKMVCYRLRKLGVDPF
ncbi:ALF repeat-containing protein, partial [Paractinoplanes deccanensis]